MDLLENAVESIKTGVEDYEHGDHGRLLAAVRSIHAGILLLYKEALLRLSPKMSDEVLIKAKILPRRDAQGNISFVGDGKKTVDVQQIKERFASLDILTDWSRFDRITNVRNEVEHYYTKTSKKALQGLISDALVVIRNFITTQLGEDPAHTPRGRDLADHVGHSRGARGGTRGVRRSLEGVSVGIKCRRARRPADHLQCLQL